MVKQAPGSLSLLLAALSLLACGSSEQDTPTSPAGVQGGAAGGAGAQAGQGADDAGPDALPAEPLEVLPLTVVHAGEPALVVEEGRDLTLRFPPQGGFVLWTTAKARGLKTGYAEVRSRLRRLSTREIVADEGRRPDMGPVPGEDGWFQPEPLDLRNVNHLPICPNYEDVSIVGQPFELEVLVTELDPEGQPTGRKGSASRTVSPVCAEGSAICLCECSPGYKLGGCSAAGMPEE